MYKLIYLDKTYMLVEGLIQTYPIDKVIEALSDVFDLTTDYDKDSNRILFGDPSFKKNGTIGILNKNGGDRLKILILNNEENIKSLSRYLNKYGYFLAFKKVVNDKWLSLVYDKKFDTEITELIKKKKYIYHICNENVKDKILKQGLTPRTSQWQPDSFDHDERVYFFYKELTDGEFNAWATNFNRNKKNPKKKTTYYLLQIDTTELHENIKFYLDPRIKNGVYSLEGIPPTAIEVISETTVEF